MLMLIKLQAKHLRNLELEHEMGAAELVGRMEEAGAHPLVHSVIGRSSILLASSLTLLYVHVSVSHIQSHQPKCIT